MLLQLCAPILHQQGAASLLAALIQLYRRPHNIDDCYAI